MLHPATELGAVSPDIGVGIFASGFIPKGTIIYIKDPLEIVIEEGDNRLQDPAMRKLIDRYSYMEPTGKRIVSWDLAKYMNHSCDANSISTGYGFEIAIRDIEPGEEITDDYGLLNVEQRMPCCCGASNCRGWIGEDDIQKYHTKWDSLARDALAYYYYVSQPLGGLMDTLTRRQLQRYLDTGEGFRSVNQLRLHARKPARAVSLSADTPPLIEAVGDFG
ncbi:MAG: SET domain-containing protein-lysine N-methyltransferase [Acidiferrobacterales bacterium]|nr:SET domain-containing protein-lysine N-methyltransferase [Acidiferrobacterales bacterium]